MVQHWVHLSMHIYIQGMKSTLLDVAKALYFTPI